MPCRLSNLRLSAPRLVRAGRQRLNQTYSQPSLVSPSHLPSPLPSARPSRIVRLLGGRSAPTPAPIFSKGVPSTSSAHVLQASSAAFVLLPAAAVAIGGLFWYFAPPSSLSSALGDTKGADASSYSVHNDSMSASEMLPGRPGNLTPEEDEKLQQLWLAIFRVCHAEFTDLDAADADEDDGADGAAAEKGSKKAEAGKDKKKKKRSVFRRSKKENGGNASDATSTASKSAVSVNIPAADDDKYGQGKLFQDALASQSPEAIRATIWSMVKHDHPDALVLRFLRARKWDVDKALVMLVSTMHWRLVDMHVDNDIMANGEAGALAGESSSDPKTQKHSQDFMSQVRMGKSFLHGVDKAGRPICVVRVRLHHQGDQSEESLERFTVFVIETARMLLRPPVDTATVVFDMTNFSLANMDYSPVKFMIKCFEANYPESLGVVLVHKAPWLFQGIWRIIRGWLDPVVAAKVNFTNNVKDMEKFIDRAHIIKELEGDEDWEYKYAEPLPGENSLMKDTATRENMLAERELLYRQYEEATAEWIQSTDESHIAEVKAKRDEIAEKLRVGYWKIDPYIRARCIYDRTGVLRPDGGLDYYPEPEDAAAAADALVAQTGSLSLANGTGNGNGKEASEKSTAGVA